MKILRLVRYFSFAGGVCVLLGLAFFAVLDVFRVGTRPLQVYIFFSAMVLIGMLLGLYLIAVLGGIFWRIRYDGGAFSCRDIYGFEKTALYSDIREIRRTGNVVYLYDQSKRYTVYLDAAGAEDFLETINSHVTVTQD
jgi:hypothetical protein